MMNESIFVGALPSIVVAMCLLPVELIVFFCTVLMQRRATLMLRWFRLRKARGRTINGREHWLLGQRSRQLWILLQICVFAPVMSLDRWVPWEVKWVSLYHIYMSLFVNFLAQLHVALVTIYHQVHRVHRGRMHAAPPSWPGRIITVVMFACYAPVMTLVVYAVSTNALWITGVAQVYCAASALTCAFAASVVWTSLWWSVQMKGRGMETRSWRDRDNAAISRGHEGIATHRAGNDGGPSTDPSFQGNHLAKVLAGLCFVVLGALYQITQGIAVINTLGPFPGYSANLAEMLSEVLVVFLICLQSRLSVEPLDKNAKTANKKPASQTPNNKSGSKTPKIKSGDTSIAIPSSTKAGSAYSADAHLSSEVGGGNLLQVLRADEDVHRAKPNLKPWQKKRVNGRRQVVAPIVLHVDALQFIPSPRTSGDASGDPSPTTDDECNSVARRLLSKLRATKDHQELEDYLMADPATESWQEQLCKAPESEQEILIQRWIAEDPQSYVLFLALGAHLSQPYETHVTSITLGTSRNMHQRRFGSSSCRDSFDRGSFAPPRARRRSSQESDCEGKLAEKAIFNTRFSWDRPEPGGRSSDVRRRSSDNQGPPPRLSSENFEHKPRASSSRYGRDTRSSDEGSLASGPRNNRSPAKRQAAFMPYFAAPVKAPVVMSIPVQLAVLE